ncbi:hypothetical protein [Tessaracoccus flavus]|uniref:Uncharacterized protein n=1 Tax=Tessaracoccus flavus TaxID=1610493 RepID=A0A1Q2CI47_9ACTN|nr:hypothetical protein [Tessaracoccus flavus]AQP45799.1 hypothetical protein RPIT_14120 [Tessaracoccus flavus]SDZ14257.1 hypothetical protein SAMN05428934_1125 [Tessaracoccus flavus]
MTDDDLWDLTRTRLFWAGILANGVTSDDGAIAVEAALPARPTARGELLRLHQLATDELTGMLALLSDDEPRWADGEGTTVGDVRRLLDSDAG